MYFFRRMLGCPISGQGASSTLLVLSVSWSWFHIVNQWSRYSTLWDVPLVNGGRDVQVLRYTLRYAHPQGYQECRDKLTLTCELFGNFRTLLGLADIRAALFSLCHRRKHLCQFLGPLPCLLQLMRRRPSPPGPQRQS